MMKSVKNLQEMTSLSKQLAAEGKRIAFIPTMGFLHEGHLSLVREGKKRGDILVVSIFVNPTQFGEGEDFDSYPRSLDSDAELLEKEGVDILFVPAGSEIYPEGAQTFVEVTELSKGLCGSSRPGHFRGVATIVAKLFNIVRPDVALFGEKDFQQLAVIRRMVQDLNFDVEIIGMQIVREEDGLAMSSRNSYLSGAERAPALSLYRSLQTAKEAFSEGLRDSDQIIEKAKKVIAPDVRIDYLEVRHPVTLEKVETIEGEALMAIAAHVGETRLIDNTILREE